MTTLYMLLHEWYPEKGYKSKTLIGVYESRTEVEKGLGLVKNQPGFSDTPDGFYVKTYKLNEIAIDKGEIVL
ncbi:hypothetical protein O4H49_14345 [Kiloniella laminariae]|uniref:Uncharacterized protein n=1 Tax=Kiloniella laminariae TaxID=454162 RepID=A0ABT4LLI3_9PROT|nr:hypothetical protein [Kiloniella laminariae]MCZ4281968.1 hypothetical protein [Kiloniella laminariae]